VDGISEGRREWRSRFLPLKLSPPVEEEEGLATRVVEFDDGKSAAVELERVILDLDEDVGMQGVKEVDMDITDDESEAGDDGDSAVGGINRKRTIRVVIRSRAFL
jgi:myosin protein heavy chain